MRRRRNAMSRKSATLRRHFEPRGSWTIVALIEASAEMWGDLADVEDDASIAEGYRAMSADLSRFARALARDRVRSEPHVSDRSTRRTS